MKRTVIASVLLVLSITIAVSGAALAKNAARKTSHALYACTQTEQNKDLSSKKIKEAVRVWNDNKKILFVITAHDDFFEIENKMTSLEYFIENPAFAESSKLSYETALMMEKLAEDFDIKFENVF